MRLILLAASGLMLAACDRGPEVDLTNATPAEVAKAMKESGAGRAMVSPGKWSSTVTVLAMESPGMPPELQAIMKQRVGQPSTVEVCLTPEQVDNQERMLGQIPASCKYDRYTMGNGKLEGKLSCTSNGVKQEMAIAGTYSGDAYSITMDSRMSAPAGTVPGGPTGPVSMKMKVDSKRLGDCDGSEMTPPAMPAGPAAPPASGNVQ